MLGLKGGLWVCKKSQKISTASDEHFLSYVKKITGGGSNWPPPLSRNRVKGLKALNLPILPSSIQKTKNPLDFTFKSEIISMWKWYGIKVNSTKLKDMIICNHLTVRPIQQWNAKTTVLLLKVRQNTAIVQCTQTNLT